MLMLISRLGHSDAGAERLGGMSHGGELHRRMRRKMTDMTSTTSALLLHIAISLILLTPDTLLQLA